MPSVPKEGDSAREKSSAFLFFLLSYYILPSSSPSIDLQEFAHVYKNISMLNVKIIFVEMYLIYSNAERILAYLIDTSSG